MRCQVQELARICHRHPPRRLNHLHLSDRGHRWPHQRDASCVAGRFGVLSRTQGQPLRSQIGAPPFPQPDRMQSQSPRSSPPATTHPSPLLGIIRHRTRLKNSISNAPTQNLAIRIRRLLPQQHRKSSSSVPGYLPPLPLGMAHSLRCKPPEGNSGMQRYQDIQKRAGSATTRVRDHADRILDCGTAGTWSEVPPRNRSDGTDEVASCSMLEQEVQYSLGRSKSRSAT